MLLDVTYFRKEIKPKVEGTDVEHSNLLLSVLNDSRHRYNGDETKGFTPLLHIYEAMNWGNNISPDPFGDVTLRRHVLAAVTAGTAAQRDEAQPHPY